MHREWYRQSAMGDLLGMDAFEETGEQHVLARSSKRVGKERSMRKRRLKKLWARLKELRTMEQSRDELIMRLGAAKKEAGRVWNLVKVDVPKSDQPVNHETFTFTLQRKKLRAVMSREGCYLLRAFVPKTKTKTMTMTKTMTAPEIWRQYIGVSRPVWRLQASASDLPVRNGQVGELCGCARYYANDINAKVEAVVSTATAGATATLRISGCSVWNMPGRT